MSNPPVPNGMAQIGEEPSFAMKLGVGHLGVAFIHRPVP